MVVGTGESSRMVIKHLERDVNGLLHPVCVVDFENTNIRGTMAGIPVIGGKNKLKEAVKKYRIDRVVLADAALPEQIRKEIRGLCKDAGVTVQNFSECFQSTSGKIPLKSLLGYVDGPVILKIDKDEFSFDDPETAAMSITEKYEVERQIAEQVGCKYAVALATGTASLPLSMKLAGMDAYGAPPAGQGVLEGKRVFCTDMTFAATVNPVVYEGGTPVFIDSERDTWNMDPKALEKHSSFTRM